MSWCQPLITGAIVVAIYMSVHKGPLGWELPAAISASIQDFLQLVRFNPDYKEQYYSALATLFAVIIALALVKGIEGGDHVRRAYGAEADTVRSILGYLSYFEDGNRKSPETNAALHNLKQAMLSYINAVSHPLSFTENQQLTQAISACRKHILAIKPAKGDADDRIAHRRILNLYERLLTQRARRLALDARNTPVYLKLALVLMAVALIAPFLAEPICVSGERALQQYGIATNVSMAQANPLVLAKSYGYELQNCPAKPERFLSPTRWSQYYMIFILTVFFSFLLQMLQDVSTTNRGFWKVEPLAFQQLRRDVEREQDEIAHARVIQTPPIALQFENPRPAPNTDPTVKRAS